VRIPFAIPAAAPFDLVGFGQNSFDYIAVVPAYPARNAKMEITQLNAAPGGQVATAVVACARLGWRTRYIGAFGSDEAGKISRESLEQEGVDLAEAPTIQGANNRVAIIVVDSASGERTVLWRRDRALRMNASATAVTAGRMLLVDGDDLPGATALAAAARQAGVATMVDADEPQPGIHGLLAHIDAIIVAQDFPSALTGHPQLGRALEMIEREFRAPLVCATLGEQGSLARCGGREIRTPAASIDCVDSTGAGDVFRGAFAAGCLRWGGGELEHVLEYANLAAGLSCRAIGARGGLPRPDELDRLLAPEP
jgi:sugar/nucleoside kinase (ribokinase family)